MIPNWTDEEIADSAQRAIDALHEYCNAKRDRCDHDEIYRRFKAIHREEYDLVVVGKKWGLPLATCLERFRAYPPFERLPMSETEPDVAQVFGVLRAIR